MQDLQDAEIGFLWKYTWQHGDAIFHLQFFAESDIETVEE